MMKIRNHTMWFIIPLFLASSNLFAQSLTGDTQQKAEPYCREGSLILPCLYLVEAARAGDAQKVRELLRSGEDPNQQSYGGPTPLHAAAENGYTEIAVLLIQAGARVDSTTDGGKTTPLDLAVANAHDEMIKLLLENGAMPLDPVTAESMHALNCLSDETYALMVKAYCKRFPKKFPDYCN